MRNDLMHRYLSRPRFNRYLTATGNNVLRAKRLYIANLRLAQAFHPLLSQFEVVLRNSLNLILATYFQDGDWIITQRTGFMKASSLRKSHYFLRSSIQKSEDKLARRGIPVTSGKIIADQTFGFWIAFFLSHHYSLVGGQHIHIFVHKPVSENRASIYDKLNEIKNFRNRVNHCEPICFNGHKIDCSYALSVRDKMYDLIQWTDPDLVPFFENMDNIPNKTKSIYRI